MTTKVEMTNTGHGGKSVRVLTLSVPPKAPEGEKQKPPTVSADQVLAPGDRVGIYVHAGQRLVIDEVE